MSSNIYKKRKAVQIVQMEKRLDEAYNHLKKASEKPKRDKWFFYGELLWNMLSELDEQEYAMLKIDKFVYELKKKNMQLKTAIHSIQRQLAQFITSQHILHRIFIRHQQLHHVHTPHRHHQYILMLIHHAQVIRCHLKICHSHQYHLIFNNIIIIYLHIQQIKIKIEIQKNILIIHLTYKIHR